RRSLRAPAGRGPRSRRRAGGQPEAGWASRRRAGRGRGWWEGSSAGSQCQPHVRKEAGPKTCLRDGYCLTFWPMSQPNSGLSPTVPLAVCSLYCTFTLAKFNVTFSVSRSPSSDVPPPVEMLVMMRFSMVICRYSSGFSPDLRTVRTALSKCLPLQQASIRSGVPLSTYLVKLKSCTRALPAPIPPPWWALPELEIPQLHDRVSNSPG